MKGLKRQTIKHKIQHPSITYRSAFNTFHDMSVDYPEDSDYIIFRTIISRKKFEKEYSGFKISSTEIDTAIEKKDPWSAYDYDRVKYAALADIKLYRTFVTENKDSNADDIMFNLFVKNNATIDYEGGYMEVLEYWEDDRFVLIGNGHCLYDGDNPLPQKEKPFFSIMHNKIPGIAQGRGIAH